MAKESSRIVRMLQDAAALVEEAGLPAELRSAAFGKAFDMLTGATAALEASSPVGTGAPVDQGDLLGRIATRLKVERDLIDDTYEVDDDGNLSLSIAKSRLEAGKAGATKQIATLLAAGRQAAGIETSTPNSIVRAAVEAYGRYDSPNFSATVKELDDILSFPGSGRDWQVKVRKASFGEVGTLLRAIHGRAKR